MAAIDWRRLDERLWPAAEHGRLARRFVLWRDVDRSGVSGTGLVAQGAQFNDGTCVLCWERAPRGVAVYRSLNAVVLVHGHGGDTAIVWVDKEGTS